MGRIVIGLGRVLLALAAGVSASDVFLGAPNLVGIVGHPVGHALQTAIVGGVIGAFYGAHIWIWGTSGRWFATNAPKGREPYRLKSAPESALMPARS